MGAALWGMEKFALWAVRDIPQQITFEQDAIKRTRCRRKGNCGFFPCLRTGILLKIWCVFIFHLLKINNIIFFFFWQRKKKSRVWNFHFILRKEGIFQNFEVGKKGSLWKSTMSKEEFFCVKSEKWVSRCKSEKIGIFLKSEKSALTKNRNF